MLLIDHLGISHSISLVSQRFPIYSQPCATVRLGGREAIWDNGRWSGIMGPGFSSVSTLFMRKNFRFAEIFGL